MSISTNWTVRYEANATRFPWFVYGPGGVLEGRYATLNDANDAIDRMDGGHYEAQELAEMGVTSAPYRGE